MFIAAESATGGPVLAIILRILHIAAGATAFGAVMFQRIALHPSLQTIDEGTRASFRAGLVARWRAVILAVIAVLLITGLLTFLLYRIPEYTDHPKKGLYHGLFGLKLLLGLAVFHPATLLVLPGAAGDRARAKAGMWLNIMLVELVLIVIIGAILRNFRDLFPG
jgi:hypothetical protein